MFFKLCEQVAYWPPLWFPSYKFWPFLQVKTSYFSFLLDEKARCARMTSTIPHFLYWSPLVVPHIGQSLEGLQGQIPMDHPIIKKGCAKLTTRVLHSEPESITKRWVLISQIHIAVVKSSSKKLATKHFSSFRSEESLAVWARKKCYGTTICF